MDKQNEYSTWVDNITEFENFFKVVELPLGLIRISKCDVITDVSLFINSHLSIIKAHNNNIRYKSNMDRLHDLKLILSKNQNGSIKESYKRHGLSYTLIKRNDLLCIYGVSGTYTDKIIHYEAMLIRIRKARSIAGKNLPETEAILSDEEFGKSKPDRHFQKLVEAEAYFDSWTANLMYHVKGKAEKVV